MTKKIMLQGTASSVGKSILTAALCRIFVQDGYRSAPFKSQNMALNSFVTHEGGEMGRAQVVQAQASRIPPSVLMNPILLKPTTDRKCQVILNGKVLKNMDAAGYFAFKQELKPEIMKAFTQLAKTTDIIVIEGAGSPAEINLKENDIVNMGMAEMADSPVLLIADIDRGGVFAAILGTIMLLDEHEKARVKGVIINKFRGDVNILKPGLTQIEELTGIPVIGVIPHMHLAIDDEDSVTDKFTQVKVNGNVTIEIVHLPHISNFTDFDILTRYDEVNLKYVMRHDTIGDPDILIIPGTKNTIDDLIYLKNRGFDKKIIELARQGKTIIGICGGLQMLGTAICDSHGIETDISSISALGILPIQTTLEPEKITEQTATPVLKCPGPLSTLNGQNINGYEIHCGRTTPHGQVVPFLENPEGQVTGVVNESGTVIGTYLHGFFDNPTVTTALIKDILSKKGIDKNVQAVDIDMLRENEFDKLAKTVRENLDMDLIYSILEN